MPMDAEARALMLELALPIDPPRREAFLAAVTERLKPRPCRDLAQSWRLGVSCNGNISTRPTCTEARQGGGSRAGDAKKC